MVVHVNVFAMEDPIPTIVATVLRPTIEVPVEDTRKREAFTPLNIFF